MLALSFIYVAFTSHLSYVLVEKGKSVFRDKTFWLLVIGLLATRLFTKMLLEAF